jgi:hypothetical protein
MSGIKLFLNSAAIADNCIGYYRKDYALGFGNASIYIDTK